MNRPLYSLCFYLLAPFIWAYLLFRAAKAPAYREGFLQRLGFIPRSLEPGGILVHCASVGESRAAAPLIERLLKEFPKYPITISTTTPTGKQTVRDLFGDRVKHVYLPIDWPGSVRRFLISLRPKLVILMETELWLNFLAGCHKRHIPVLLANARLSEKSLRKYQKHAKLAEELFTFIDKIAAQFEADKDNFLKLGVKPENIEIVGSIKFDLEISATLQNSQLQLKQSWAGNRPVWIAASIHPAEFELVLNAHRQLLTEFSDLLLIGVPRHPEKFAEFKTACEKYQFSAVSRSESNVPSSTTKVVVGDTMGEVLLFCGVADVAFVGGSLIERGGHNPLEPVACGLPVIMGPHFYNFSDISEQLISHHLLNIVQDEADLTETLRRIIGNQQQTQLQRSKALAFMAKNRGCVERLSKLSEQLLKQQTANLSD